MRFRTLEAWLRWQEGLHPHSIDLGLERVSAVATDIGLVRFKCPVLTVGGTNGKGSCVALLQAMLVAGGYRVGAFTSPHLVRYNERITIGGRLATDDELIDAFARIDAARGERSLTFFEFNTLAALLLFQRESLDAVLLEVGLGGRLDAVNIVDADVALLTSVALDHCEWLGNTVEEIGREKAGIFRAGRPAVLGTAAMPQSVFAAAHTLGRATQDSGYRLSFPDRDRPLGMGRPHLASARPAAARAGWTAPARQCGGCDRCAVGIAQPTTHRSKFHCARFARGAIARALRGRAGGASVDPGRRAQSGGGGAAWPRTCGRSLPVVALWPSWACSRTRTLRHSSHRRATRRSVDCRGHLRPERHERAPNFARVRHRGSMTTAWKHQTSPRHVACARSEARAGDRIVVFGSFQTVGPALEWLERETSSSAILARRGR